MFPLLYYVTYNINGEVYEHNNLIAGNSISYIETLF